VARRKLSDVTHPDLLLTDDFWLQFGDDPQPPMRLKVLYLTFGEVALAGPSSFNVASVCDRLGITYPMVNHYFGGRDGLLAEAAAMVYENYIGSLRAAVVHAPPTPEDRLKAWMMANIAETGKLGGWGPILNYPLAAREVTEVISEKFQASLNRNFEANLSLLSVLVSDIRHDRVSNPDFTAPLPPRDESLQDTMLLELVPIIAWTIFGMSVWIAGQHAPARQIREVYEMTEDLVSKGFRQMMTMIRTYQNN
jgi:AcrR family transcriptional regulator